MELSKGYWVIQCQDVDDSIAMQKYIEAWNEISDLWGAKFIAGKSHRMVEGVAVSRMLILEFPSYQAAQDCYDSEKYQKAKVFALQAMQRTFTIVEGV